MAINYSEVADFSTCLPIGVMNDLSGICPFLLRSVLQLIEIVEDVFVLHNTWSGFA